MGEALDFENDHPELCDWNRFGKVSKITFTMTINRSMKQQIKDLGGVVAVKHLITEAHKKLKEAPHEPE